MDHFKLENMTLREIHEQGLHKNRNSDITTEEFRQLLAEEITPEDIWWRRGEAKRKAEEAERKRRERAEIEALKPTLEKLSTRTLLMRYRSHKPYSGNFYSHEAYIECQTLKAILDTREHIPTGKKEAKMARREAAMRNRGNGKAKNR